MDLIYRRDCAMFVSKNKCRGLVDGSTCTGCTFYKRKIAISDVVDMAKERMSHLQPRTFYSDQVSFMLQETLKRMELKDIEQTSGVHAATLRELARNKHQPSYEVIVKLAQFYKTSPNVILGYRQ